MSTEVVKGQKADLTKGNPGIRNIIVEIGWKAPSSMDIDASAFLLGAQGKVNSDDDLIFYNNPSTPYIRYKDVPGAASGGLKQFEVGLDKIPAGIAKIAFTLTLYDGENRKQMFGQMSEAQCRILDQATGAEILRCNLGNHFSVETAVVVGELYRYGEEWKFSAIVAGFSGGLKALCGNYGIEVEDEPAPAAAPQPVKTEAPPERTKLPVPPPRVEQARPAIVIPPPPAPKQTEAPAPPLNLNLKKIELKKKGDSINLKKSASGLGELVINLNWNQKQGGGLFSRNKGGVDLDLACLYELKNGSKGVVQALGNAFGNLQQPPYIMLDGDDRTGSVTSGENLRINGSKVAQIERILVFSFIYKGVTNWSEADGVVTLKQDGGPDIVVNLDEHNNRKGMCAIALIRNVGNETFSIERLVQYFSGHKEMDEAYGWGLRWVAGSK
ncbi:tellurium resistance protein TerA [Paenibacillus sp. IHB B 3415]|uniref:TerD family protein n=1 Tax=Paenibacillus sp. IHB B 3415 TaxID=867080 RepID=UPI0005751EF3|nr:TerD family protein [Paenibacillus sp. IHB B 3415]KHL94992.1 tellurium resistance protein TerA [Paenibacillus sp. IHB B 3415]